MERPDPYDTIVAVSTPVGESGIGIVRLSGPEALGIADRIFVPKDGKIPSECGAYTVHYGHVMESRGVLESGSLGVRDSKIIDEALLTVMKAPKSYTREDIVEINCHGGIQAVKEVLELTVKMGARIAEPGEFTKRAFLNGRIDLTQAEAVLDIIRSRTDGALKAAVNQLEGGLSKKVNRIRDRLVEAASHVEAAIDFPEEELRTADETGLGKMLAMAGDDLRDLIATADDGIVLREGVLAIICGKPNVGKSSLMNLLLRRERVIVTPVPGTTRDAVEEMMNLKGVPIRLVDTAGIAAADDMIGSESVRRSKAYLELSDLVLFMIDASSRIDAGDMEIAELISDKKKLVIVNKIDLPRSFGRDHVTEAFGTDAVVEISVKEKRNIGLLEKAILGMVWSGRFTQGASAVVTNARHKALLEKALDNVMAAVRALESALPADLVSVDLREAIFNLGLITGTSVSDDILDRIFEQFCIGK
jgi:tRNA modification GTPase